jgi:CheY-like chemotaxis protein
MPRILVIEDNEAVRSLIVAILHDHTVFEAGNGREGLEVFNAQAPELVITDMIMPEMGGLEMIAELRQAEQVPKIIAMSGSLSFPPDQAKAVAEELGVERVLSKPFSLNDFLQAVEGTLAQSA